MCLIDISTSLNYTPKAWIDVINFPMSMGFNMIGDDRIEKVRESEDLN